MRFMSLQNTVAYQVNSSELLETLDANNAPLRRGLEMKGIKIAAGI